MFDRIMYDTPKRRPHSTASTARTSRRRHRRVRYHYVIVDYACRLKRGRLAPASDVVDARWVRREDLPEYHLTEMATSVVRRAFEFFEKQACD